MKKIISISFIIFFIFCSCSKKPQELIIGKWKKISNREIIQFVPDGTFIINSNNNEKKILSAKYKFIENEKILIESLGGLNNEILKISITDDELVTKDESNGAETKFRKVKEKDEQMVYDFLNKEEILLNKLNFIYGSICKNISEEQLSLESWKNFETAIQDFPENNIQQYYKRTGETKNDIYKGMEDSLFYNTKIFSDFLNCFKLDRLNISNYFSSLKSKLYDHIKSHEQNFSNFFNRIDQSANEYDENLKIYNENVSKNKNTANSFGFFEKLPIDIKNVQNVVKNAIQFNDGISSKTDEQFQKFWEEFKGYIIKNNKEKIVSMTYFPLKFSNLGQRFDIDQGILVSFFDNYFKKNSIAKVDKIKREENPFALNSLDIQSGEAVYSVCVEYSSAEDGDLDYGYFFVRRYDGIKLIGIDISRHDI